MVAIEKRSLKSHYHLHLVLECERSFHFLVRKLCRTHRVLFHPPMVVVDMVDMVDNGPQLTGPILGSTCQVYLV